MRRLGFPGRQELARALLAGLLGTVVLVLFCGPLFAGMSAHVSGGLIRPVNRDQRRGRSGGMGMVRTAPQQSMQQHTRNRQHRDKLLNHAIHTKPWKNVQE